MSEYIPEPKLCSFCGCEAIAVLNMALVCWRCGYDYFKNISDTERGEGWQNHSLHAVNVEKNDTTS